MNLELKSVKFSFLSLHILATNRGLKRRPRLPTELRKFQAKQIIAYFVLDIEKICAKLGVALCAMRITWFFDI